MNPHERSANQATWSVIIGALLGVVLFLGAAYSRQLLAGLILGILIVAYFVVLAVVGRINVIYVLWGAMIDEDDPHINRTVIVQATVAMALVAMGTFVYDLFSDADWGWLSWLAALIAFGYLASLLQRSKQGSGDLE